MLARRLLTFVTGGMVKQSLPRVRKLVQRRDHNRRTQLARAIELGMNDLPQTRNSLLLRLKSKGSGAWKEFLCVYEQAIYTFCRSKGLQDADALDVKQDVFSAVLTQIDDWNTDRTRGSFRGWLLRVARNIAVDRIRGRRRPDAMPSGTAENLTALAHVPEPADAEEAVFEFEYRCAAFQWAAKHVRQEVQETTWLSFWKTAVENKKPTDVAQELGISVGSIYTAKCRVVARLRDRVAEIDDDASGFEFDESQFSRLYRDESD